MVSWDKGRAIIRRCGNKQDGDLTLPLQLANHNAGTFPAGRGRAPCHNLNRALPKCPCPRSPHWRSGRARYERQALLDAPRGHRNGYGKPRKLSFTSGTIEVKRPRVRGLDERFESAILPLFARRTQEVGQLLPELYLHGLSQGDFERARPRLSALWSVQGRLWPKSPTILSYHGGVGPVDRLRDVRNIEEGRRFLMRCQLTPNRSRQR